jgi:hypothetical protein
MHARIGEQARRGTVVAEAPQQDMAAESSPPPATKSHAKTLG